MQGVHACIAAYRECTSFCFLDAVLLSAHLPWDHVMYLLDIALNIRRNAVFGRVHRPRREFEKRKREFVAQICGDSF